MPEFPLFWLFLIPPYDMHISWLGSTAVKLQVKPFDNDVTIIIDPYKPALGAFPRNLLADIAIYTQTEAGSISISGTPFVISHPGEWEVHQVLMAAIDSHLPNNIIVRLDVEEMRIAHLGRTDKPLNDIQLDLVSGVDILFVPVGGEGCYEAQAAAKIVNMIEPRIVIPVGHKSDNDPQAKAITEFVKEMGSNATQEEKKVIIKQKDLPQDDMRIIVLNKE